MLDSEISDAKRHDNYYDNMITLVDIELLISVCNKLRKELMKWWN